MKGRRTKIDFTGWTVKIDTEDVFRIFNCEGHMACAFRIVDGITLITGYWGVYTLSEPRYPHITTEVPSDDYWASLAKKRSTQDLYEWNEELMEIAIAESVVGLELDEDAQDWFDDLESHLESEVDFLSFTYNHECPLDDYEIPLVKRLVRGFRLVLDAFEWACLECEADPIGLAGYPEGRVSIRKTGNGLWRCDDGVVTKGMLNRFAHQLDGQAWVNFSDPTPQPV
jgi:hypothetical protein